MAQTILPNTYIKCANENETCKINTLSSVSYKATDNTGQIYFRDSSVPMMCDNVNFGNPDAGKLKECSTLPVPYSITSLKYDPVTGLPDKSSGFNICAIEGSICNPSLIDTSVNSNTPIDILFGADKNYTYANIIGSIDCMDTVFGDVASNNKGNRVCLWRKSTPQNAGLSTFSLTSAKLHPSPSPSFPPSSPPPPQPSPPPPQPSPPPPSPFIPIVPPHSFAPIIPIIPPTSRKKKLNKELLIGILVGGFFLIIIFIIIIIVIVKNDKTNYKI